MSERAGDVRARIDAVCRMLEERLDEGLPLEELARAADLSPFHFHRLFRGLTGETVRGYTRRLRIERAAHRLEHTEAEILSIALDSGYGSHEAFTRAFKKHFGLAPSEYRGSARASGRTGARRPDPITTESIELRIEEREPCTVACVRHVGPYSEVGEAWKALMKWGWTKVLFGSPQTFGLCYDDPEVTDPERVRYDACMVVAPNTRVKREVELKDVAGGHFAVALHVGEYSTIGATYAALFAAVTTRGAANRRWQLGDPPALEVYLNDPRKTKPPELRTEVWMPVHPA